MKKREIFLTLSYYGNESAEFAKKLKKTCKKYLPLIQINIGFQENHDDKTNLSTLSKKVKTHQRKKRKWYIKSHVKTAIIST